MSSPEGHAQAAMRAGIVLTASVYDRVSQDLTGLQRSVEEQEDRNRAACADNGWHLPDGGVYCDNDRSASRYATKSRPDWDRLRGDIAALRYHVVVLWEVSRGDRDDLGWLGFLHMCRDLGILIHITSHHHTYDPRRRRDYKTLAEEGLDSADESEKIAERIRRDTEAMANKGRPHGMAPYGYRREYAVGRGGRRYIVAQLPDDEPQTATSVKGEESTYTRAGVVREIFARLLDGEACSGVAADLNRRGIPSPRRGARGWHLNTVRNVAVNAAYAGVRMHKGREAAPATWPALVSREQYDTLVTRLNDPARNTRRDGAIRHLGSGLFVCGVCGQPMRVLTTVRRTLSYWCRPAKLMARPEEEKRRKVTDAELQELRGLDRHEQTGRILEMARSGVTQVSIAEGLGLNAATLNWRLKQEVKQRGEPTRSTKFRPPVTHEEYLARGMHVSRDLKSVDRVVQAAVWMRLLQPDLVEMLRAQEDTADEQVAVLNAEIVSKQRRLDEASDAYAAGELKLAQLTRIEARLEPEIKAARAQLTQLSAVPVVDGLLLPTLEEVQAEWWRRPVAARREVIRALIERVEILPVHDTRRYTPEESVRIVWRTPEPLPAE